MREARGKSQAKEGLWRKVDEGSMERKGHLQNIAWSDTIRFQAITSDSRDTSVKKRPNSLPDRFTHPSRVGIGNIGESEGSTLDDCSLAATFERSEKGVWRGRSEKI
jgi:hypothetical protein